jgi:deoxyribodipyrimidine photo-lyase
VARDAAVGRTLREQGVAFLVCKDQVIFEIDAVLTQGGRPFTVFTLYKNAWLTKPEAFFMKDDPVHRQREHLVKPQAEAMPTLAKIAIEQTKCSNWGCRPALRLPVKCSRKSRRASARSECSGALSAADLLICARMRA